MRKRKLKESTYTIEDKLKVEENSLNGEERERENRCEGKTGYDITTLCFGIVELLSSSLDRAFLPAITAVSSQATIATAAVTVTAVTAIITSGYGRGQDRTPLHRL